MSHYTINHPQNIRFFDYNTAMKFTQTRFTSQTFNDTDLMIKSSINWHYDRIYKLMPDALTGKNSVILLPRLQLSYGERKGGLLYTVTSPKGSVSLGVVTRADGKACFGETKLQKGDILFFDDKKPYMLTNNDHFHASVVSIPRKHYRKITAKVSPHIGKIINDRDGTLAMMLQQIRETFQQNPTQTEDAMDEMENMLLTHIDTLLQTQEPYLPKLTKGERIALQIRDRIYKRITKKVTISSLAEEFDISEQTLQNAFKSLFGITPNRFLRNLKLNHVRKMLVTASNDEETIVRIANQWGFTHMGHFSRYYTDLFGENPSLTLQRTGEDGDSLSSPQ